MQFHHGQRLKNFIDKSPLSIDIIVQESGVAKSSLYDMVKKEELLYSKIKPVLDIIKVSQERFYKLSTGNQVNDDGGFGEDDNLQLHQIIKLLTKQVEQQAEMITILKKRK